MFSFFKPSNQVDAVSIERTLTSWSPSSGDIERYYKFVHQGLESVTRLTEYEDKKASRILGAMAFLTALVAALNVSFIPLLSVDARKGALFGSLVIALCLFYFLSLLGSSVIVWAIHPRFNIKLPSGRPTSFLFAPVIDKVNGVVWAQEFSNYTADQVATKALKDEIVEVKLIAHKAMQKVRWLRAGSVLFVVALALATIASLLGSALALK